MNDLKERLLRDYPFASDSFLNSAMNKINIVFQTFKIPLEHYGEIYDRMKIIEFDLKSSVFSLLFYDNLKDKDEEELYRITKKINQYKREIKYGKLGS